MHACEVVDADKRLLAAVDYYFIQEDGKRFKVFVPFLPYFYIKCKSDEVIQETSAYLSKKFGGLIRGNFKLFVFISKVLLPDIFSRSRKCQKRGFRFGQSFGWSETNLHQDVIFEYD